MSRVRSRSESLLLRIGANWGKQTNGKRFFSELVDFLKSIDNIHTLRGYSFAIIEFFTWLEVETKRIVTPDYVTRADAKAYVSYLKKRTTGLTEKWLDSEPGRELDRKIYKIVSVRPGIGVEQIRSELRKDPNFLVPDQDSRMMVLAVDSEGGLGKYLADLVRYRILAREPSVEEIRLQSEMLVTPEDEIFRYYIPKVNGDNQASRAGSIVAKLNALSSLWEHYLRGEENIPGKQQPLLRYNIWDDLLEEYRPKSQNQRIIARIQKTPTPDLLHRLLTTTFAKSYGQYAPMAAEQLINRGVVNIASEYQDPDSFNDVRDRCLLILLSQTGIRAGEIAKLQRKSIVDNVLKIDGKGGRKRIIGLPAAAKYVLNELSDKLSSLSAKNDRFRVLLLPDAPLIPAISYWGANTVIKTERGLSRQAIAMCLRRRAYRAGIAPGSEEMKKIHPHGFRHLFAKTAVENGTPINRIQAILGHSSLATTSVYVEEHDPAKLIANQFQGD